MQLSELFLNRWLYKNPVQTLETLSSVDTSMNSTDSPAPPITSGGAAQDINTGNVTIDGAQLTPGTYPVTVLDVSNWGWTQTSVFTSTSATQVNWGSGTFTSAGGVSYSISAGNTGTMAAKTYIYLDLNVSLTTYQHTTTSSTAVGIGKVLVAVAQNNASAASFTLNVATQIVADNLIANSIDASKIVAGSITATQIASSTITTTQLNFTPVQSTNVLASINASTEGITINGSKIAINGTTTFSSGYDPTTKLPTSSAGSLAYLNTVGNSQIDNGAVGTTKVDTTIISGGKIVTGLLTASNIQTGTLDASVVTVTNLNASNITSGTISVGGTSQPGTIKIQTAGEGYTSAKIYWVNSSGTNKGRIWTDDNGYLGMNALGGELYFYAASSQVLFLSSSAQAVFGTNGLKVQGAFNIGDVGGSTVNARINGGYLYFANTGTAESIYGGNASRIEYNASTYHYHNIGGNLRLRLSDSGMTMYSSDAQPQLFTNWIRVTGSTPYLGWSDGRFNVYGAIVRYTSLINDSDRRLKKNIKNLEYGLKEIVQLNPVRFEYIEEETPSLHLGLVAQEVEDIIPEVVSLMEDTEMKGLSSTELIPVLINAIKELSARVEKLESR